MIFEIRRRLKLSFLSPQSPGCIATILREKYKNLKYLSDQAKQSTWDWIVDAVTTQCDAQSKATPRSTRELDASDRPSSFTIDDLIADEDESLSTTSNEKAEANHLTALQEVQAYRIFKSDDRELSAIDYWSKHGHQFPSICLLAKRILAAQPSTAESERVFSQTALVSTRHRASLAGRTLENLTFAKYNDNDLRSDRLRKEVTKPLEE